MTLGLDIVYYVVADNFLLRFNNPSENNFSNNKSPKRKIEPIAANPNLGKYLDEYV